MADATNASSSGPDMGDDPLPEDGGPSTSAAAAGIAIKKKQRVNGDKLCRVCGDRALAHNFDVITCESCKAFFRRNALKNKIKPCAFNGNCDVNIETRRFCPHCRLQRCLNSGMKSDMILGSDERKARLEKMAENRRKRQQGVTQGDRQTPAFTSHLVTSATSGSVRSRSGSGTISGSGSEDQAEQNAGVSHNDSKQDASTSGILGGHEEMTEHFQYTGLQDVFLQCAVGDYPDRKETTFQHVPREQLPSDLHMYWNLTDEERATLAELTSAYQDTVLKPPQSKVGGCPNTVNNIMARCSRYPQDIVNFVKRFKDFRLLSVEDQVAVMKGASFRTFLVKLAANYILERDAWIKDDGYLTVTDFAQASGAHAHRVYVLASFSSSLKQILRSDPTALALLQCITLFDPRDANISDRQLVNSLADKYNLLLKHHMESQFSYLYAAHYLDAVRQKLEEMQGVTDVVQAMFVDWVDLLEPLMREVLNLG